MPKISAREVKHLREAARLLTASVELDIAEPETTDEQWSKYGDELMAWMEERDALSAVQTEGWVN